MSTDEQSVIAFDRPGAVRRPSPDPHRFRRAGVDGVELEYEVLGTGDPVVLIHAGVCADWFAPLLEEPALRDAHQILSYHRAGYAGSERVQGELSIARQAAQCAALMRHAGIGPAHVVGHSSSANMALQLALDAPELVRSVSLLETALLAVPSGPYAGEAVGRYRAGDRAGAVDAWMRGVCGPNYREPLERAIPGAFDQAVADLDTFLGQELPALRDWPFTEQAAARVGRPALAVLGARSDEVSPVFRRRHELLLAWLPDVEGHVLPDANHLLHVQNPRGMAERLASFFATAGDRPGVSGGAGSSGSPAGRRRLPTGRRG
ncbi:MAG TPA: alpha/beta hydrolase [Mycobacteriales bacterium]|jgi:pimeloyl-ACP methyl ester carboxylesterase